MMIMTSKMKFWIGECLQLFGCFPNPSHAQQPCCKKSHKDGKSSPILAKYIRGALLESN